MLGVDESELVEFALNGRDVNGNPVTLPGVAGSTVFEGTGVVQVTAVGPDNVTRNITITGSEDLGLLAEAIGLIQFTNIVVPDVMRGSGGPRGA